MFDCAKCGESRSESEFYRYKTTQRRYSSCKDCLKKVSLRYHSENPGKYRECRARNSKKRRDENRAYLWELKSQTPCTDCGRKFHPIVMQFDHVRGVKRFAVSEMSSRGSCKETILKEIAKCEIVCTNCHLIRTYNRRKAKT